MQPVISGLPVSNRDHGVNGGDFLDNGTLLMAIGGMTNQGYPGDLMGGLPESPLSGAILQAKVCYSIRSPVINIEYIFALLQISNSISVYN